MEKENILTRKSKALETKTKIYKSAERLFEKYGFENVSVDSIVKTAGVSKGAFYVHFESKDSLIATLIANFVNELDLDYKSYLESFHASTISSDILINLAEKIADIIAFTIGYGNVKFIYNVQITKRINTNSILGYNRDLYKVFNSIIERGVQHGEFRAEIAIDTITKHFIMAIRGLIYEWCIRYPHFDLKEQIIKHFKILLTGIKTKHI